MTNYSGDISDSANFSLLLENVQVHTGGNIIDWEVASDASACQWSGDGTTYDITPMLFGELEDDTYTYTTSDSLKQFTAVDWTLNDMPCSDDKYYYSVLEKVDRDISDPPHLNASILN